VSSAASLTWLERAAVIPGRSMTRSKKVFGRFAESAAGALIRDTDGRVYIDMLCGLGAVSLGYGDLTIKTGVYSLPHRVEVEAAEAVLQDVAPWGSWVRFTKTGSEATHAAYRIAKAATGREDIIRFAGAYHGWHEWTDREPSTLQKGYVIPHDRVAAYIVEPSRFDVEDIAFLKQLRNWCDLYGSLLIYDSMIYGGRWHIGGLSGFSGVQPDLECLGKAYGNGQAVSFAVGTDATKAHGEIPSGTFSGEVSGLHGLLRTLKVYRDQPVIETMWARGQQLLEGLQSVIPSELGTPNGNPPCQRISWSDDVPDAAGWRSQSGNAQRFTEGMLERGVLWHPSVTLTMFAHTEQQISEVIAAAKDVVSAW
jgi:glutamate-1-semialdehyde aminotransferase